MVTSGKGQLGGTKYNAFATNVRKPNPKSWMLLLPTPPKQLVSTSRNRPLVIPLTVGAVAAAAVLALLESDLGRTHYLMIYLLPAERYL